MVSDPNLPQFTSQHFDTVQGSKFEEVVLPRFRRRVDVYESTDFDQKATHAVVTRIAMTDDIKDKSFLARLYMGRLGKASDVQRSLSSKSSRHRTLYIGAMPDI